HDRVAERETGAEQRAVEALAATHANLVAVEFGAASARCREQFLPHGIVDAAVFEAPVLHQSYGDGEHRKSMQVVRGAIQWIDHPQELRFALCTAFYRQDGVVRVVLMDGFNDRALRRPFDLADEIVAALYFNLDLV